jgi:glycosyltransferase involved in cell wall biosynthesis
VPEVIDSAQGVLVAPDSSNALADGLRELVTTMADYDREQLRARAVSDFGYDAIAHRWANVYAAARRDSRADRAERRPSK